MSVGRYFIHTLLAGDDVVEKKARFLKAHLEGITPDAFEVYEERKSYEFIQDHFQKYGSLPSRGVVHAEVGIVFPSRELEEPFEFWKDSLKEYRKENLIGELLQQAKESHDKGRPEDRDAMFEQILSVQRTFGEGQKHIKKMSELIPELLDRHNAIQRHEQTTGIRFGLPYFDAITGGAQPSDLWVIAGDTGSGKTFLNCRFCLGAVLGRKPEHFFVGVEDLPEYMQVRSLGRLNEGEDLLTWEPTTALFISMEMSNLQVAARNVALGSLIDANDLRRGSLSMFGTGFIREFEKQWKACGVDDRLIMVEGNINSTIEDVLFYMRQHKPGIVFLDGAYLLKLRGDSQEKQWERISKILETLKVYSMNEGVPIICSFQFDQKAKEKKAYNIMGGQSISQLASVILGIADDTDDMNSLQTGVLEMESKVLTILKGRSGEKGQIKLLYNMNTAQITESSVIGYTEICSQGFQEDNPFENSLEA